MMRMEDLRFAGADSKMDLSRTEAYVWSGGVEGRRFQISCRTIGDDGMDTALGFWSTGPTTRRTPSMTLSNSIALGLLSTMMTLSFAVTGTVESPLMTSKSRTHRHNDPTLGSCSRIFISASRILASVYFSSVKAAVIRAVRFALAIDSALVAYT